MCQYARDMRCFLLTLALTLSADIGQTAEISTMSAATKAPASTTNAFQASSVKAVKSSGPGQAGYVHYFLIG